MAYRYPTFFISHGTPMLAFGEDHFQEMLAAFGQRQPKPKAIVVVSAHTVSADNILVSKNLSNRTLYDFSGFPQELYEFEYDPPGSPDLADRVIGLLREHTFQVDGDSKPDDRTLIDHGIWVPLMHMYPKADVPIVRVSLPLGLTPTHILKMGRALAPLREEGVMIMGSGGAVHNLRELTWHEKSGPGANWATQFEEWLLQMLQEKNVQELAALESAHPEFHHAHPSHEHYLPLLFTVGAALKDDEVEILKQGIEYGTLSMLSFALNKKDDTCLN